ncbi:hypothetical protein F5B20DRAFT_577824 [Whalleya microplaca]|nr:hypothetical protein F5B20DRAFT_577824 [Whalleya microplaca]
MGCWGRGLFQSDDDYDIARDLEAMFGFPICFHDPISSSPSSPSPSSSPSSSSADKATALTKLNTGLLAQKFDKILSSSFVPRTSYHARSRVAVLLGALAMELGAVLEERHVTALRVLRRFLPTLEQQLQLGAMLAGYRNDGTPWVRGSKGFEEAQAARSRGVAEGDLGDEFWFSGLGHSADESPTSDTVSRNCLSCGEDAPNLLRCTRCKMARYCNDTCQAIDWSSHKIVCYARDGIRSCPVPSTSQKQEVEQEGEDTASTGKLPDGQA